MTDEISEFDPTEVVCPDCGARVGILAPNPEAVQREVLEILTRDHRCPSVSTP